VVGEAGEGTLEVLRIIILLSERKTGEWLAEKERKKVVNSELTQI
jgi:hypothetical protein